MRDTMDNRSEYIPRGLRNKWRITGLRLATLLLVVTLMLGLQTWMTLPAASGL
jgi:hypothetical protein